MTPTRSLSYARTEDFKIQQLTWGPKQSISSVINPNWTRSFIPWFVPKIRELNSISAFRQETILAEVAREYSQGPEAYTCGLLGPVELSMPHPALAKILSISQPGQYGPLTAWENGWWLCDWKLIPAQLNEPMRQQLLNRLFEAWTEQLINWYPRCLLSATESNSCSVRSLAR